MKKTCNGCRALGGTGEGKCELGYITGIKREVFQTTEWGPLEECPKPITYEKYYEELEKGPSK